MDYHFILGILGGLCSIIAIGGFYIVSILKGETKPNKVSWAVWSVTNIILLASYFSIGARSTIFLPLVYAFNGLIILILSFRYGVSSWSRLDKITLAVAGLSLVIWFFTQNPLIALVMVLMMDAVGYLPTLKKIANDPLSESKSAWIFILIGSCFNITAINSSSFGIIIHPLIMLIMNGLTVAIFYLKKISKDKAVI